jgi:hypothetical protein
VSILRHPPVGSYCSWPATDEQLQAIIALGGRPAPDLTEPEARKAINALKRRRGELAA